MDNKSNDGTKTAAEQVVIIEEKISKVNGETQIKRYARGKILGKGGFAKCYEVTNLETKKLLAAKIIPKASLTKNRARQKLISEIKIHKSLHHTNVVQFEHVFEDHENVYILLELCTNQTLNELLRRRKRLTELEVQCYLMQIISSLKYLHQNRVIHRDLKLGNLFLNDKMEIKLGDFGLATKLEFEGERKRTICGTPNYIAPEILDGKNGHSYEVDFWSLGVIIYALLIGKPPFETPDVKTTYKKIRMNSYSFPDHVPISDPARNIITRILNLDPARRPNLDEIVDHPFLNNGGTIPKLLPLSTLACPPSASYIKQFQPQGNTLRVSQQPQRLSETAPGTSQLQSQKSLGKSNLINTEKVSLQKPLIESKNTWGTSTQSNWTSTNNLNNRPMTQKADIKPTQSVKSIGTTNNQMFATQTNMGSMQSLNSLGRNIKTNTLVGGGVQTGSVGLSGQKQEVWVKQWVDYSSKYGLGYLLSNGSCGVFFNDSTKIIMDPSNTYFEYIERRPQDKQDLVNCYTINEYPKELQKKVTLLQHFKSYLEGEKAGNQQPEETDENWKNQPQVYVKKWMKTKHAIMFRLSNKIVQVNFTDKTEILLSSENKLVTYVNKKGERSNYPLATALESTNTEMAKRLKYTKEILTHMLGQNNNANMGLQRQSTAGLGDRVDL